FRTRLLTLGDLPFLPKPLPTVTPLQYGEGRGVRFCVDFRTRLLTLGDLPFLPKPLPPVTPSPCQWRGGWGVRMPTANSPLLGWRRRRNNPQIPRIIPRREVRVRRRRHQRRLRQH